MGASWLPQFLQTPDSSSSFRQRLPWNKTALAIGALTILLLTGLFWTSSPAETGRGSSSNAASSPPSSNKAVAGTKDWPGWEGITHMITFGDSYTSTGFNLYEDQPSEANPLGNPAYPGLTTCNGPNWVDFLTTKYNQTFLKTLDFAMGGATVDHDILPQFVRLIKSFKDQVEELYLPNYSPGKPLATSFGWKPDSTLFTVFFGINDICAAVRDNVATPKKLNEDIARYTELVDKLYQSGARNFVFMNVPPIDRSPSSTKIWVNQLDGRNVAVREFNAAVYNVARNLSSTYSDATTFLFDTNRVYNQVLVNPCSHEETCMIKNTTDHCSLYEKGTDEWDTFFPECGVPVDQYFWWNALHPTYRIMEVTAKELAAQLSGRR